LLGILLPRGNLGRLKKWKIETSEKLKSSDKQRSHPKDFRRKSWGSLESFPEKSGKASFSEAINYLL
jgi:hypothetical protein